MPVRTTPAQIRKMFRLTVTEMEHQIGRFVKRPGKDFTRHRSCTFQNTILAIMTMEAHSLKRELFEYFRPLKKNPPTRSAFIQSRKKLNDAAFPHLLRAFNDKIPFHNTYKGLHLLACDGTDSNIPADAQDLASLIPFNSNNGGYYQNHTVVMFDLLEKRYTDAVIQPRREINEVQACCEMIDRTTVGGLKVNEKNEVLNEDFEPIPGLYAGGSEAGGLYGASYDVVICAGSQQGWAVHSGKRSAESAKAYLESL